MRRILIARQVFRVIGKARAAAAAAKRAAKPPAPIVESEPAPVEHPRIYIEHAGETVGYVQKVNVLFRAVSNEGSVIGSTYKTQETAAAALIEFSALTK